VGARAASPRTPSAPGATAAASADTGWTARRAGRAPSTRAAFASLLLFVFTRLGIGPQIELAASVLLCLLALAIYIPLGFATDRWVYNRRQKRKAAAG
jgi:hypothetical protein